MPLQAQSIICTLLKILIFISKFLVMIYLLKSTKLKDLKYISFSVKCKLCSGLEKAWGLSALLMLNFACFEFDLLFLVISVCFGFHLFNDEDLW